VAEEKGEETRRKGQSAAKARTVLRVLARLSFVAVGQRCKKRRGAEQTAGQRKLSVRTGGKWGALADGRR